MNIPGVTLLDSGVPGPTLGLLACTHGDEPAGLAALNYVGDLNINRGRIFLIIVNLKGKEAYQTAQTDSEKRATRYIDINFNRLPEDALELDSNAYEIQRLKELMPVFEQLDVAMDIHSTTQECDPMFVAGDTFVPELVRGFPIKKLISRIDTFQIGLPGFAFYGGTREIPCFEIESGSHENPKSKTLAIECSHQLLINLGMIDGQAGPFPTLEEYEICDSVVLPDQSYSLVKVFLPFVAIQKGELIACGNGPDIVSPCDGHAIFAPKGVVPAKWDEEVFFISKSKRIKTF